MMPAIGQCDDVGLWADERRRFAGSDSLPNGHPNDHQNNNNHPDGHANSQKKTAVERQPFGMSPHQSRYAGILNLAVQVGHGQFNFGFIGLATLTPIELCSTAYAHKWFKEYMALANTAGN